MVEASPLWVDARDVAVLRDHATEDNALGRRAQIVLLAADGLGPTAIAEKLNCSKQTVITWRERFRSDGLAGLLDAPRSGRPTAVAAELVLARTLEPPPAGAARWTTRLLGEDLGISNVAVANAWRGWGISPGRTGRIVVPTRPVLDDRIYDVAALHVSATLRLVALSSGTSRPHGWTPVADRPDPGPRINRFSTATSDHPLDEAGIVAALLIRLDALRTDRGTLRLVIDGAGEQVHRWAADRDDVAVHDTPAELRWERLAQIALLLAAESSNGARNVDAARAAADATPVGSPFTWTREPV